MADGPDNVDMSLEAPDMSPQTLEEIKKEYNAFAQNLINADTEEEVEAIRGTVARYVQEKTSLIYLQWGGPEAGFVVHSIEWGENIFYVESVEFFHWSERGYAKIPLGNTELMAFKRIFERKLAEWNIKFDNNNIPLSGY